MTEIQAGFPPVDTHIASITPEAAKVLAGSARPGGRVDVVKTVVLTATNPSDQLLPQDKGRLEAVIFVSDNPVVICGSEAQAGRAVNTTAGLATPDGFLMPNGTIPLVLRNSSALWVTAAAYPTRVSVLALYPG